MGSGPISNDLLRRSSVAVATIFSITPLREKSFTENPALQMTNT
jgi:hypothetical protein